MAKITKRLTLDMPEDVAAWVAFMAAAKDTSKITFVNDCIRENMSTAPEALREAFAVFQKAKEAL